MNRSDFLKKLGIGLGVAVVAPKMLAEDKETNDIEREEIDCSGKPLTYRTGTGKRLSFQWAEEESIIAKKMIKTEGVIEPSFCGSSVWFKIKKEHENKFVAYDSILIPSEFTNTGNMALFVVMPSTWKAGYYEALPQRSDVCIKKQIPEGTWLFVWYDNFCR